MNKKYVAILILNWNNYADTIDCLESLKNIQFYNYHIYLLDNKSDNNSVAELKKHISNSQYPKISLIESKKNLGYAGGNNYLINKVKKTDKYAYVLLLNNDCLVTNNLLKKLVGYIESNPKIGAVSPVIYNLGNRKKEYGCKLNQYTGLVKINYKKDLPYDYLAGTCLLIKTKVFRDIGLLNEKLFLYFEDYELSYRMKKANYLLKINQDICVKHKVSQSTDINSSKQYYLTRNRFWIAKKYFNHVKLIIFICFFLIFQTPYKVIVYTQKKNFKARSNFLKGIKDGILNSL